MTEPDINKMLRDDFAVDPPADEAAPGEISANDLRLSDLEFECAIQLIHHFTFDYFEQCVTTDYAKIILAALYDAGFKFDSTESDLRNPDLSSPIEAIASQRDSLLCNHTALFRLFKDTLTHHRSDVQHISKVTDGIEELIEGLSPSQLKGFLHLIRTQCDRSIANIDKLKKIELDSIYQGENYDDSTPQ